MAETSAALVKQLREKTGAGMMDCKRALDEAKGNIEEAEVILRKKGIAAAAKRQTRSARQGTIGTYIHPGSQLGVMVEVNCETDFVARTEDFQGLVKDLAKHIADHAPQDAAALLLQPFGGDPGVTVEQMIKAKITKTQENIVVARFASYHAAKGALGTYIHPGSQLGVMVQLDSGTEEQARSDDFQALVKDIAMHIAAADPKFLRRDEVPAELLAKERDIASTRARNEGKPDKVIEKIVEGRLAKFYEEVCLLDQPFIKENTITIEQMIKAKTARTAESIVIAQFARFKVGETAAAPAEESAEG